MSAADARTGTIHIVAQEPYNGPWPSGARRPTLKLTSPSYVHHHLPVHCIIAQ